MSVSGQIRKINNLRCLNVLFSHGGGQSVVPPIRRHQLVFTSLFFLMQMETISIERRLFLYFFRVSNVPTVTALPPGGADLTCENVVLLHDVRGVFFFFFFFYTVLFFV